MLKYEIKKILFTVRAAVLVRSLAIVILSICLSVCPSHTCFVTKPNNALRIFWYHMKGQSICYSDTNSGWWATPPSVWNLHRKLPTPFEECQLCQISAHNVSTIRDSKKVQSWQIGSRPQAFQRTIYGVCTLPLSPPKGGSKSDIFYFEY